RDRAVRVRVGAARRFVGQPRRPGHRRRGARPAAFGHAGARGVEAAARTQRRGCLQPRLGECRVGDRRVRVDRRARCRPVRVRGAHLLMPATDIAVVGYAQTPSVRMARESEVQLLVPIVSEALARAGLDRREVGFTCAGSCDYLTGGPFAFVSNLEAAGAWPPISESHVEMDGAWALYEAWVRLQHGDIDTALVFGSGKSSPSTPAEMWAQQLDPYYLAPLGVDPASLAGIQARALIDSGK